MVGCRRVQSNFPSKTAELPKLSLGLSSVKCIVGKFQKDYIKSDQSDDRNIFKYDYRTNDETHDFPLVETKGQVRKNVLKELCRRINRCIPRVTFANFSVIIVLVSVLTPKMISYFLLYPICRLVFGTLYPAYASYKAVRTKNLKEYVSMLLIYFNKS